jgi:Leucine-rich repeat (LRR) protein
MSASITAIDCGTSSPKLGGTIDISAFPNLTEFFCINNDITAISGYENNANLRDIRFNQNLVTGSIPSLSALIQLQRFRCPNNQLTGSIPSLSANTGLLDFYCQTNQLTGTIPSLSVNTELQIFHCATQQGLIKLTGPIPNLDNNTQLRDFYCFTNQLTGPIPSLSANTFLRDFRCQSNQLTGFAGGSVANTLERFEAHNNQLTSAAVNAILAAFVAANKTAGTRILNLGGTGNAAPTGQGLVDKQTLLDRGWRTGTGSTAITN